MSRKLSALLLLVLTSVVSAQQPPATVPVSPPEGAPVTVARSKQYDLTSRINGLSYRVMVATPFQADSTTAYPVVYVLDGNWYFGTFVDAMTLQGPPGDGPLAAAIVVGIGYPTEDRQEMVRRRLLDYTPFPVKDSSVTGKTGGGEDFLRVLEEEIKPLLMARYRIDSTRQIIYGHSLGGHIILRSLFRHPERFSTYLIASPTFRFNDREILADEGAFSKRARSGELRLKVFIAGAANEDSADDSSKLATRLSGLHQNVSVVHNTFGDEVHHSVPPATISRGLRVALPRQSAPLSSSAK